MNFLTKNQIKYLMPCSDSLLLMLITSLVYTLAYLGNPYLPGNTSPDGWLGFFDQSKYQEATAAIANWNLNKSNLHYPIGYSLLASPFFLIAPKHAFFIINLISVLVIYLFIYKILIKQVNRKIALIFLSAFVLFHQFTLSFSFVVPWNTIPTAALLYIAIYFTLHPALKCPIVPIALSAALNFFTRPSDTLFFVPLLFFIYSSVV